MADFIAVIRRAVDGLPENTQATRDRVYERARSAITRQLNAMDPKPDDEVIRRQLDKLEDAIHQVEAEHSEALPAAEPDDEPLLDEAAFDPQRMDADETPVSEPVPDYAAPEQPAAEHEETIPGQATAEEVASETAAARLQPYSDSPTSPVPAAETQEIMESPPLQPASIPVAETATTMAPADRRDADADADLRKQPVTPAKTPRRRPTSRLILALVVLVALGAGGYWWAGYSGLLPGSGHGESPATPTAEGEDPFDTASAPETQAPASEETPADAPSERATPAADTEEAAPEEIASVNGGEPDDGVQKFTQRLRADGTETDPGPADDGGSDPAQEGQSLASRSETSALVPSAPNTSAGQASQAEESVSDIATPPDEQASLGETTSPADQSRATSSPALGVSQKLYLYEERLAQQAPTALEGTVTWSIIDEPPSEGATPEPAIRAELSVPEKGLTALMTIKRNADPSLPASHLIEIVVAVSEGFDGGGIDSVQRVSFKRTEQEQGNPLIAVPAKITDDFFMVALNDYAQAVNINTRLLRERNWIDIPVIYKNGRRALLTLEKGSSGVEVFEQTMTAWAAAANEAAATQDESQTQAPAANQ